MRLHWYSLVLYRMSTNGKHTIMFFISRQHIIIASNRFSLIIASLYISHLLCRSTLVRLLFAPIKNVVYFAERNSVKKFISLSIFSSINCLNIFERGNHIFHVQLLFFSIDNNNFVSIFVFTESETSQCQSGFCLCNFFFFFKHSRRKTLRTIE